MNLAIIIPLLEKYGGAERYLIECAHYWQERHEITLYSTEFSEQLLREHGISDKVGRRRLTPYFEGEHAMLLNALLLPKIWQREIGQHDLYHTHLWPTHLIDLHPMVWLAHEPLRVLHDLRYEQNVVPNLSGVVRNVHIYPKYHYDHIGDSIYESYLSAIDAMDKTANPECMVGNSSYTARYLEQVYDAKVNDVVYPGVKPEMFFDLPVDPNLFVTISQLWPHKRINLLIEAIALTDETQLIVIGSGPEQEKLLDIAAKLGVEDRVFFLSGLSNRDLSLVLSRACAFLFAPINEPFGIVVLEAMAAGVPVIAVNQGGYVEACHPDYAFLLPPFPSAFAEKISYLQQHPEVARRMGAAGRKAAERFTWQHTAQQLETVLLRTLEEFQVVHPPVADSTGNQTLVGIHYYLWYDEGFGSAHWNDNSSSGNVTDKPLLGYYSSTKGQTIDYHLDLFEQMGLDYVILSLHVDAGGFNELELTGIQHVFKIAQSRNSQLRFAIQLAPYTDDAVVLEKLVSKIQSLFASHENHLRLDGKPVLFWFWSSALDGNRDLISSLKKASAEFTNLAASLRLPDETNEQRLTFGMFDGFAPFSPTELADRQNWQRVWSAAYLGAIKAGMRYRIAALSPGYDDSALEGNQRAGNPYRVVARNDGATYLEGMRFIEQLGERPDLVMISTFNEFHENSHIEPSLANGMRYVEMTQEFVVRIKHKWGQS